MYSLLYSLLDALFQMSRQNVGQCSFKRILKRNEDFERKSIMSFLIKRHTFNDVLVLMLQIQFSSKNRMQIGKTMKMSDCVSMKLS